MTTVEDRSQKEATKELCPGTPPISSKLLKELAESFSTVDPNAIYASEE